MDARTETILNLFHDSWIKTELMYDNLINNYPGFEHLKPLRLFISKLKAAGEDNFFRIGTSMFDLIISRSVNFGLRTDQKYIKIAFINVNAYDVIFRDGEKIYREYRLKSLDDQRLDKLLKTLKDTLVD